MNYFLVDYENVNTNGFRGITSLSEDDSVIIFYSERAETMTFGLHQRLNESKADISLQKVPTGIKNALDFQLCTYLGYLIGRNEQSPTAYYIVSADQGYAMISAYWTRRKVSVSLISEICAASGAADEPSQKPDTAQSSQNPDTAPVNEPLNKPDVTIEDVQARLKTLLPEKYQSHLPTIAEIIRNGRTKQNVHGELMKTFHQGADNSVPNEIYQSVKPLLLGNTEYLHIRLESALPSKYKSDIPVIAEIIQRHKTKQEIYTELARVFHQGGDNSVPGEIYRSIKPLLTDKT